MTAALLALAALTATPALAAEPWKSFGSSLPHTAAGDRTPAQRVAVKALAGDYGKLAEWQRKGYAAILRGTEPRLLVVTGYWHGEEGGTTTAAGTHCKPGVLASNKLPRWLYVYMPTWGRLFRVEDCGSQRNDKRDDVTRHGPNAVWADVWLGDGLRAMGRCDWTATHAEVAK